MMGRSLRYVIWSCICMGVTIMVAFQFAEYTEGAFRPNELILGTLLNPQKVLFNNMLFFAALIYISYRDYMNPLVALRCKNSTFKIMTRLAIHGVKLIFVYEAVMLCSVMLAGCLLGMDMRQINVNLTLVILMPVCWYCIYFTFYVLSRKHYVGMIGLIVSQLIVLLVGVISYVTVEFNLFPYVFDYRVALPAAICLCCIAGIVQEKRDWI